MFYVGKVEMRLTHTIEQYMVDTHLQYHLIYICDCSTKLIILFLPFSCSRRAHHDWLTWVSLVWKTHNTTCALYRKCWMGFLQYHTDHTVHYTYSIHKKYVLQWHYTWYGANYCMAASTIFTYPEPILSSIDCSFVLESSCELCESTTMRVFILCISV